MKKLVSIIICLFILLCTVIPVFAEREVDPNLPTERIAPYLTDGANLLTRDEQIILNKKLEELSQKEKMDIVIVTATDLGGKSPQSYADDFFDYNGFGYGDDHNGILLLYRDDIPGYRDIYISTTGKAIKLFNPYIDKMLDKLIEPLSQNDFDKAFNLFIKLACKYNGFFIDITWLIIAVGVGVLIAFVVMKSRTRSLTTAIRQLNGDRYVTEMALTKQSDTFLFKNVHRVRVPKQTTSSSSGGGSHRGSSGRSHGGGGRRF